MRPSRFPAYNHGEVSRRTTEPRGLIVTNDLIEHNPLLKASLRTMLALSAAHPNADRRTLEEQALEQWDAACRQSPAATVDILVRNGALVQHVFVDGAPYDGTLEDLQLDEAVAEDAAAESRIALTDVGRELLDAYAPEATLRALIDGKPHYRAAFTAVLAACNAEEGCSRANLEAVLNALPELAPDPDTQQTRVYPQFFIDALESAGGIAWQGAWRTTDAGKALIAA